MPGLDLKLPGTAIGDMAFKPLRWRIGLNRLSSIPVYTHHYTPQPAFQPRHTVTCPPLLKPSPPRGRQSRGTR
jgi:hypothetical protein